MLMAKGMKIFQYLLHIIQVTDEVGNDDEVELLIQQDFSGRHDMKFYFRELLPGLGDHAGTVINTYFAASSYLIQQFARAAANFQYGKVLVGKIINVFGYLIPIIRIAPALPDTPGREFLEIGKVLVYWIFGCIAHELFSADAGFFFNKRPSSFFKRDESLFNIVFQ
jgi:hypothetical protein